MTPKGDAAEIVATLEAALALEPGASRRRCTSTSTPSRLRRRRSGRSLRPTGWRGSPPAAGHLVHMPAHIYARVGRYADSMAANREAIAADEAFLAGSGDAASRALPLRLLPAQRALPAGGGADVGPCAGRARRRGEARSAITSDGLSAGLAWVQAIRTAPCAAHAPVQRRGDDPGAAGARRPLPLRRGLLALRPRAGAALARATSRRPRPRRTRSAR